MEHQHADHTEPEHAATEHEHDHEGSHGHGHGHEGSHDHDHEDSHDHDHEGSHGHDHDHGSGLGSWLATIFHAHGHSGQREELASDPAFAATAEGIRTVWIALATLVITSLVQVLIVFWSGSVALLA